MNKTPAQAFTAPAEKKMDTNWTFVYYCSGWGKHEKWLNSNHFKIFKVYLTSAITRAFSHTAR